jgi:dTDP-4-amino-4,6-dideoxygalactose transaminase
MIKFLDLKKNNQRYELDFQLKFRDFLDSGWYILGDELKKFEEKFSNYIGVKHSIGVANGLDALIIIFESLIVSGKLRKGDEVLVQANTYIASIISISKVGLIPVLVDVNINNYSIDVNLMQKRITKKTKAILVVHLYGQMADINTISQIAEENNLFVVEDCAQSHGASVTGKMSGSFGIASAFSFYPGKNLGCLGDGGIITTNDDEVFDIVSKLRNYGSKIKYENDFIGYNSRLDVLQAMFLSVKLPYLENDNIYRKNLAQEYIKFISNKYITLPQPNFNSDNVWHLFVIKCSKRNELQKYLFKNGIETLIHYPIPPYKQNAYKYYFNDQYPVSDILHDSVLSLPLNPEITYEEQQYIIDIINKFNN